MPSVGPVTAAAFVATIDDARRFEGPHQVQAYLGLVPTEESSGERRHLGHISKQGNTLLRFLLVAAMNPCPCGYRGHPLRACRCTPDQVERYQARISGPLLDRIDVQIEVPTPSQEELLDGPPGEPTVNVAERVSVAHARQLARQGKRNALLAGHEIDLHCARTDAADGLLRHAMTRFSWSARAYARVLKLARTIADLAGDEQIDAVHVGEAIQYRRGVKAD